MERVEIVTHAACVTYYWLKYNSYGGIDAFAVPDSELDEKQRRAIDTNMWRVPTKEEIEQLIKN